MNKNSCKCIDSLKIFQSAILALGLLAYCMCARAAPAATNWTPPTITLPDKPAHPIIAATSNELARLRAAWQGTGPEHDALAALITRADAVQSTPVEFPPRGGQHIQWYQCDKCQVALTQIEKGKHQCRICKKIYSGDIYEEALYKNLHGGILVGMLETARAYAITGDEKYARHAALVLTGYAKRYLKYPFHANTRWNFAWAQVAGGRLYEQTLSEASALALQIAPAYDLVFGSPALSAADHEAIRSRLILPMLQNIDKYKAGQNNWQAWHNAAMFAGGAVINDPRWMRKAIFGGPPDNKVMRLLGDSVHDERIPDGKGKHGFLWQLKASTTEDGMWYEMSWGYHFYALNALVSLAESARCAGMDLWHAPGFENLFTMPVECVMPNGAMPRFGDDVRTIISSPDLYEPAYAAYRNPVLLAALSDKITFQTIAHGRTPGPQAKPVQLASRLFKDTGLAILRSNGDAELAAAFTFGPYGGYHGHLDKLSFVLFGFGEELAVDPGRARVQAYRLPIHANWYKATLSHNAVLVDGQSQAPAGGKIIAYTNTPKLTAIVAECDQAWPGVTQRRTLILTDQCLLVFDDLSAKDPHRFDWLYHNRGTNLVVMESAPEPCPDTGLAGAEYLGEPRAFQTDAAVQAIFKGTKVDTHLALAAMPGTRILITDGPFGDVTERVPLLAATRNGNNVRFLAVLAPVRANAASPIRDIQLKETTNGLEACVAFLDREETISLTYPVVLK